MTRVTRTMPKLSNAFRSISSSSKAAQPTTLLESQHRHAAYLPRKLSDLKAECTDRRLPITGSKADLVNRLVSHDISRDHSTFGGHRPTTVQTQFRPLMQGFRSSAPIAAAHDTSTIDFFFLPEIPPAPPTNPFSKLRVPLLPDNYYPDRSPSSGNAVETLDGAVPPPEISIVASHPENVAPAAMTEVVRNEGLDVDIGQLTASFTGIETEKGKGEQKEPGLVKELFTSMIDDILGTKPTKAMA